MLAVSLISLWNINHLSFIAFQTNISGMWMTYRGCQHKPWATSSHTIRIVHYAVFMGWWQRKPKMFRSFMRQNEFFIKKSEWKRARGFRGFRLRLQAFISLNIPAKSLVLAKPLICLALTAIFVRKTQGSSEKSSPLALLCIQETEPLLMYTFISCMKQELWLDVNNLPSPPNPTLSSRVHSY